MAGGWLTPDPGNSPCAVLAVRHSKRPVGVEAHPPDPQAGRVAVRLISEKLVLVLGYAVIGFVWTVVVVAR